MLCERHHRHLAVVQSKSIDIASRVPAKGDSFGHCARKLDAEYTLEVPLIIDLKHLHVLITRSAGDSGALMAFRIHSKR